MKDLACPFTILRHSDLLTVGLLMVVSCLVGCDSTGPVTSGGVASEAKDLTTLSPAGSPTGDALGPAGEANLSGSNAVDATSGSNQSQQPSPEQQLLNSARQMPPLTQGELAQTSFANMQAIESKDAGQLESHIAAIDRAMSELIGFGNSGRLQQEDFVAYARRLGNIKFSAGKQLAEVADGNQAVFRGGSLAQLEALSHLTGLRDMNAARVLEGFANELLKSDDVELAHQAAIVLAGFKIQALQNGQITQPDELLAQIDAVLSPALPRSYPELMVAQQASVVLQQLGFTEAQARVTQLIAERFSNSENRNLRGAAWQAQAAASPALENLLNAIGMAQQGENPSTVQSLLASARQLYQDVPSPITLEELAGLITNLEYSGAIASSHELATFVRDAIGSQSQGDFTDLKQVLDNHDRRVGLVGQDFDLPNVVDFSDVKFDFQSLKGKVVLVDFWATWCGPCLEELPNLRAAYDKFHASGLEVVGVNLDENITTAQQFVQERGFPWISVHPASESGLAFESQVAKDLGIQAIPFLLLIGRDGKVSAVHVRGPRIETAVDNLLSGREGGTP
ncbi:MAG: TlpA family protein disulfide reductase [Planctomycetales bacterium]|nr:TlpA family protein disulfide reductase [Planctomycetales bacterium]